VMEIVFNFRAVCNGKSQPVKDGFHFLKRVCKRMQRTNRPCWRSKRDIVNSAAGACLAVFKSGFGFLKFSFGHYFGLIHGLAKTGTLFAANGSHVLEHSLNASIARNKRKPESLQIFRCMYGKFLNIVLEF